MIDVVKHKWKVLIIITAIGLFADLLTKQIAVMKLKFGIPVPIIGEVLQWQLVYNPGALFGFNPQKFFPSFPVNTFFYIFSTLAFIILLFYYKNLERHAHLSHWGISLIVPGAMGNLIDRIIRQDLGVVDFIRVSLGFRPFNPWPNFNLADAYITIGLGMVFFDMFYLEMKRKKLSENLESPATQK